MKDFKQYLITEDTINLTKVGSSFRHITEPEDVLKHHNWKPKVKTDVHTEYHHEKHDGHEIRLQHSSGDWHHWDKNGDSVSAGFTGEKLKNHLGKFHGVNEAISLEKLREAGRKYKVCPKCGSPNRNLMPTDFETAKCADCGKCYQLAGAPTLEDFRKLKDNYNPIPGNESSDQDNDKNDHTESTDLGPRGPRDSTNMEGVHLPTVTAPSDYSPRIAAGNNIMPESNEHFTKSLRSTGWKMDLNRPLKDGLRYTHSNMPGHEIHVSKSNFLHQHGDRDIAHGSHKDLKTHLNKIHGMKEAVYQVKKDIPAYNHTTDSDSVLKYGATLHHSGSTEDGGELFKHPVSGHEFHVDKPHLKHLNKIEEGFADPSNHPFHATAIKSGFSHSGSSSALGAATHEYNHTKSNLPLRLKTTSSGNASWQHGNKSGTNQASLSFHTGTMSEETEHPLHSVLASLGYEKASTHSKLGEPTNHMYMHSDSKAPRVTLHSMGDHNEFTVHHPKNSKADVSGESSEHLKKAIASFTMKEGLLDFLKKKPDTSFKPIGPKVSPQYKTNHTYSVGGDIDPQTVPIFKPKYDYSKPKSEREE